MASELDDLRSFLESRIRSIDPSIDVSSGSAWDVGVITPLITRLAPDPYDSPIEEFARTRLRSAFPDLVIQKGEPIDDMVIKPFRALVEPLRRTVQALVRNQSIIDPKVLNDREADALGANFFVRRRQGGFASGIARIYFNAPRFALVTTSQAVFNGSKLRFLPVENQAISAENMIFNVEGSLYYFDVVVRAEKQGKEYNIERNTLVGIENLTSAVKVTNPSKFDGGDTRESTEAYLARVERSLTEKSLVTVRGITARLTDLFDSVRAITVVGFGDPEMTRDLVKGEDLKNYAVGMLRAVRTQSSFFLSGTGSLFSDGFSAHTNFVNAEVEVGDVVRAFRSTGLYTDHTITEITSGIQLRVDPAPADATSVIPVVFHSASRGQLTIGDIPGGIVQPQTVNGELTIENNKVHIGGMVDVNVRAGDPQERTTQLLAVRDGEPLGYGLDLETFGANGAKFVQLTPPLEDGITTTDSFVGPGDATATLYVRIYRTDGTVIWYPSETDVGRYVELLGTDGAGTDYGLYEILSIGELEYVGGQTVIGVQVRTDDQHTGTATVGISDRSAAFDLDFRIVESISAGLMVRDRSATPANFVTLGAQIGDSIVLETSADAGIYTIRKIVTSIQENDSLLLDRALSATVTPSGAGDYSGVRYRLDNAMEIDLVDPRVVKMPLGSIFAANDLNTIADSQTVSSTGTSNFVLAGVEAGDTLEVTEGENQRKYSIISVDTDELVVSPAPPSTEFNLTFMIYRSFDGVERPLVRVKDLEILDSTKAPTGIKIPYGDIVDARAFSRFSNRSNGKDIESLSGQVVSTSPMTHFRDTESDFVAQGIRSGYKLEIFAGDNAGEYEVAEVLDENNLLIIGADDGDKDFVVAATSVRYQIGEASTGVCRLYFLEPTSVEIDTGVSGGRLEFTQGGATKRFHFAEVEGYQVLPASDAPDQSDLRDMVVVRSVDVGSGNYNTVVELQDESNPSVFDAELQIGDVIEVHNPLEFKNSAGSTLRALQVHTDPAGLRTISGSNRVYIPSNSVVDFTQMGTLVGQYLYIDSGADAKRYTIVRVVDAKTLELDSSLSRTTLAIRGKERATLRDGFLEEYPAASGKVWLNDPTDAGQLIGAVDEYITIMEARYPAIAGTYKIAEVDYANTRVRLIGLTTDAIPLGAAGTFGWVRTDSNTESGVVEQPYHIYASIAKEVEILEVGTKAPDVRPLGVGNILAGLDTLQGTPGSFSTVERGDRLEVLDGTSAGIYPILSATTNTVTVYAEQPFSAIETGVRYRVWAGEFGSARMITVGPYQGSDGLIAHGPSIPYRIRRPGVYRVSSTTMADQREGGLYYADIDVVSLGPGNDRNLERNSRMVVTRGARIDGYTYRVSNPNLTFSPYEEVQIVLDRRFLPVGNTDLPENRTEVSGRNIQVRYEMSSTVQTINTVMRSASERPVNANPVVKHALPSFVYTSISYRGGASASVVGSEIEDMINHMSAMESLEVSDIEKIVSKKGATWVKHPIVLTSITHDLDRKLIVDRSEDAIGGASVPYNGSARISSFFAVLDETITLDRQ